MIILQAAIVCGEVQELVSGNLNYIDITNEFWGTGFAEFQLALSWIKGSGTYNQEITLTSPSGEIIANSEGTISNEGKFHTSIIDFEVDFDEIGIYYISIKVSSHEHLKLPLIVNETE